MTKIMRLDFKNTTHLRYYLFTLSVADIRIEIKLKTISKHSSNVINYASLNYQLRLTVQNYHITPRSELIKLK